MSDLRRLRCWWDSWAGTWLDPWTYRMALQGITVRFDGHIHGEPRYRIEGDREYQWTRCARCGTVIEEGWREMP
jgi:hypothetical protein